MPLPELRDHLITQGVDTILAGAIATHFHDPTQWETMIPMVEHNPALAHTMTATLVDHTLLLNIHPASIGTVTLNNSTAGVVIGVNHGTIAYHVSLHVPKALEVVHHIPEPVKGFVGRQAEIQAMATIIQSTSTHGSRCLIGIWGMGGIGKTQLAYTIGHHVRTSFPDGQMVVYLRNESHAPLSAIQCLQLIVEMLDPMTPIPTELHLLKHRCHTLLSTKRMLLIADDVQSIPQIAPLLEIAGLCIIVTSRNRLSLADYDMVLDLEVLDTRDAVTLLKDVFQRKKPRTRKRSITTKQAHRIVALCGYLPIAITLAAGFLATSSSITPAYPTQPIIDTYIQTLEREDTRLKLLAASLDTDHPHASIEAVLNTSYHDLTPEEAAMLCESGVFTGSITAHAATTITQHPMAVLERLACYSLMYVDERTQRYHLHDLVRLFALDKLDPARKTLVHHQHATYYLTYLQDADQLYRNGGTDQALGAARLIPEQYQIDTAWAWVNQQPWSDAIDTMSIRFAEASATFCYSHPYFFSTYRAYLTHAHEAAIRQNDQKGQALIGGNLGLFLINQRAYDQAMPYLQQDLALMQTLHNEHGVLQATINLGYCAHKQQNYLTSKASYDDALVIARSLELTTEEGIILGNLSELCLDTHELEDAARYATACHILVKSINDQEGQLFILMILARIAQAQQAYEQAIPYLHQATKLAKTLHLDQEYADAQAFLATIFGLQANHAAAQKALRQAIKAGKRIDHPSVAVWESTLKHGQHAHPREGL